MIQGTLDFEAAAARADRGVKRSAERAERLTAGWVDKAADMLRAGACILHTRTPTGKFTVEELRLLVADAVQEPPDRRAWGAATRAAVSKGFLERVKGEYAPAASSNGAIKPLYRKGPNA